MTAFRITRWDICTSSRDLFYDTLLVLEISRKEPSRIWTHNLWFTRHVLYRDNHHSHQGMKDADEYKEWTSFITSNQLLALALKMEIPVCPTIWNDEFFNEGHFGAKVAKQGSHFFTYILSRIVTDGPQEKTVADFWTTVFEQVGIKLWQISRLVLQLAFVRGLRQLRWKLPVAPGLGLGHRSSPALSQWLEIVTKKRNETW